MLGALMTKGPPVRSIHASEYRKFGSWVPACSRSQKFMVERMHKWLIIKGIMKMLH